MNPERAASSTRSGTTPLPNVLFDTLLPMLSDTELRVLLIVARSTLGWKEGNGRKQRDWLSHVQLQRRTGRSGAPVSRAIDSVVKRKLLVVQDEAGIAQHSARQRRALRGNLFFRMGDGLLDGALLYSSSAPASEEAMRCPSATLLSQVEEAPDVATTLESGLHFLKTTKETDTKYKSRTLSSLETKVKDVESEVVPLDTQARDEQVAHFLALFARTFCDARPDAEPSAPDEKDVALLRSYFERGYEKALERWLPAFFACSFGFVRRHNYSLHAYLHCFFSLQAKAGRLGA